MRCLGCILFEDKLFRVVTVILIM